MAETTSAPGPLDDPEEGCPRLSVIIPTFNRAPILGKCLEALAGQSCDGGLYEVLVADDGSSDATRATVRDFAQRGSPRVRYLQQENSGANAARNRGIGLARGAILLFINDDTIATPDMLAEHLAAHDLYPDDWVAVLGRVTLSPALRPSRLGRLHLDRAYASLAGRTELDWRAF
ncbi:MAG TPA: glycosyltransferase family A protein, partial [Phycisphaerae bacterium]|nr:glycosyltransferase family A protein [Phycisphaerae bacterium]